MNQKERSSYDTILQILKSDATLLADSVVDNIMATQREKIKKMIEQEEERRERLKNERTANHGNTGS